MSKFNVVTSFFKKFLQSAPHKVYIPFLYFILCAFVKVSDTHFRQKCCQKCCQKYQTIILTKQTIILPENKLIN